MGWLDIPLGGGAVYEVASPTSMLDSWLGGRSEAAGQAAGAAAVEVLTSPAGQAAAAAAGTSAASAARAVIQEELDRQRAETTAQIWRTVGGVGLAVGAVGLGYWLWKRSKRR